MLLDIQHLRQEYGSALLDKAHVHPDPVRQFEQWFKEAIAANLPEPNAMVLATCSADGRPSARVVLLKGVEDGGFVFYTNYNSRKGQDLKANSHTALVFNWLELHRQVRIEGRAEPTDAEISTAYFQSRPKGSQIGAWASPQSSVIEDRDILEASTRNLEAQYAQVDALPRPPHWGGYIVRPVLIEFWQGRASRLHDRLQYTLQMDKTWLLERLAP